MILLKNMVDLELDQYVSAKALVETFEDELFPEEAIALESDVVELKLPEDPKMSEKKKRQLAEDVLLAQQAKSKKKFFADSKFLQFASCQTLKECDAFLDSFCVKAGLRPEEEEIGDKKEDETSSCGSNIEDMIAKHQQIYLGKKAENKFVTSIKWWN